MIVHEFEIWIKAFLLGVGFATLDGLLEPFRRLCRRHLWMIAISDIIFWLALGICVLLLLYCENDGKIRIFVFISMFIGVYVQKKIKRVIRRCRLRYRGNRNRGNRNIGHETFSRGNNKEGL